MTSNRPRELNKVWLPIPNILTQISTLEIVYSRVEIRFPKRANFVTDLLEYMNNEYVSDGDYLEYLIWKKRTGNDFSWK